MPMENDGRGADPRLESAAAGGARPVTMFLRHLAAVALLPFTVTVLVPAWIARSGGAALRIGTSAGPLLEQALGLAALGAGLLLFGASLRRFAADGRGTLAPWDPPRRFVVRGPYQYVRNPMISGVILILAGEALALRSPPLGLWAAGFALLNMVYIPFVEEPQLERRFGEAYRQYRRQVRRFVPRLTPWRP